MLRHNKNEIVGLPTNNLNMTSVTTSAPPPPTTKTTSTPHHIGNKNVTKASACNSSALDVLPKQFVLSMKTLFDILDDHHTGFVKFSDIEKGWQDDGCKGLPKGVIESLRKVTPSSGLLSFERFCAGLKLCLLRNQAGVTHNPRLSNTDGLTKEMFSTTIKCKPTNHAIYGLTTNGKSPLKQTRPPSAPLLEIENPLPTAPWNPSPVRHPPNMNSKQRTLSLPQLSPDSEIDLPAVNVNLYNSTIPPPKPPRASAIANAKTQNIYQSPSKSSTKNSVGIDKRQIRHALQNWQMNILLNEMDTKDVRKPSASSALYLQNQMHTYRGSADGSSSSATDSAHSNSGHTKKITSKRREPRRHTLQNGVDYNMMKRSKQLEEEREMLLMGLEAVEKARNWYMTQLTNVQDRIKYLRMGTQEQWSEVQQERLNFQRARVLEVNRNLAVLTDTWERGGFPSHFNLAIRTPKQTNSQRNLQTGLVLMQSCDRLRLQNRHLIDEVNVKSERITLLEREKQALIHELYELQQSVSAGLNERSSRFVNVLSQPSPVCSSSSGGLGDADVVY